MKKRTIFKFLLSMAILFIWACEDSDDSDSNPDGGLITIQIDEYPRTGDLVTTINSNLSGDLTYSIAFESISSAVDLFGDELRVLDWLLFDFETLDEILVDVEVSNGNETEVLNYRIQINDVDDIAAFLSGESRTAYDNAGNGEWVMIEESEYNDIANYLAGTHKSGTADSDLLSSANTFSLQSGVTYANDNGATIPSQHYLIGLKYYSWANNAGSVSVKISNSNVTGPYEDVGNVLPDHNSGFNHFILKGSDGSSSSEAFIAIYSSVSIGGKNKNDYSYKRENGNVNSINGQGNNGFVLYQGLSSSLKQWD
jgi:hypothetical protein